MPGETGGIPNDIDLNPLRSVPLFPGNTENVENNPRTAPLPPQSQNNRPPAAPVSQRTGNSAKPVEELPIPPAEVRAEVSQACQTAIDNSRKSLDDTLPANDSKPGANAPTASKGGTAQPGRAGGVAGRVDEVSKIVANSGKAPAVASRGAQGKPGAAAGTAFGKGGPAQQPIAQRPAAQRPAQGGLPGKPPAKKKGWFGKLMDGLAEAAGRGVAKSLNDQISGNRRTFNNDMGKIAKKNPEHASWIERFGRSFINELSARTAREGARRGGVPSTFPGSGRLPGLPGGKGGMAGGFPNDPRRSLPGNGFPPPGYQYPSPYPQAGGNGPVIINNGGTVIVNNPGSQPVQRAPRRKPTTFPTQKNGKVKVTLSISFGG
jgi:hypothetical protein